MKITCNFIIFIVAILLANNVFSMNSQSGNSYIVPRMSSVSLQRPHHALPPRGLSLSARTLPLSIAMTQVSAQRPMFVIATTTPNMASSASSSSNPINNHQHIFVIRMPVPTLSQDFPAEPTAAELRMSHRMRHYHPIPQQLPLPPEQEYYYSSELSSQPSSLPIRNSSISASQTIPTTAEAPIVNSFDVSQQQNLPGQLEEPKTATSTSSVAEAEKTHVNTQPSIAMQAPSTSDNGNNVVVHIEQADSRQAIQEIATQPPVIAQNNNLQQRLPTENNDTCTCIVPEFLMYVTMLLLVGTVIALIAIKYK